MYNIAVVGCGYWGPNLIRNMQEVADAEVKICCDQSANRLDFIKKRYPHIETTQNDQDIIENPDIHAVCVAIPASKHYEIAKKLILNGKHVLIEKPFTTNVKEAEDLIELAEKNNVVLMAGHTFEYTGAVNVIKELIEKDVLGELFFFESSRVNLGKFWSDVNVVWDLASHDLSIMYYVIKKMPVSVQAKGFCHIHPGNENLAYITLNFKNNMVGFLHVSWISPIKLRRTIVSGSRKMIVYDDVEPAEKVKVYDKGVEVPVPSQALLGQQLIYRSGDIFLPKLDQTEPLLNECREFIGSIREKRKPRSDGESGLRVVRILSAIQESMKNNGKEIFI